MDISQDYYKSVMRDFAKYGRGHLLEQYCRVKDVDYKWLVKAQEKSGIMEKYNTISNQNGLKMTWSTNRPDTPDTLRI